MGKEVWKEVTLEKKKWHTGNWTKASELCLIEHTKKKKNTLYLNLETFYLFSLVSPWCWAHRNAVVVGISENGYTALLASHAA